MSFRFECDKRVVNLELYTYSGSKKYLWTYVALPFSDSEPPQGWHPYTSCVPDLYTSTESENGERSCTDPSILILTS